MTDDLRIACAALVALKDAEAPRVLPSDWLQWALPFCPWIEYDYKVMAAETVDVQYVVSSVYGTHIKQPATESRAREIMDNSDALVIDKHKYDPQTPRQSRIGSLPLYCACEGKNRVSLFKAANRSMRAFVTPLYFPEAQSLDLVRTWPHGTWQAVLGGRVADVPCQPSLNVLRAYGARVRQGRRFDLFARRRMDRAKHRMLAQESIP